MYAFTTFVYFSDIFGEKKLANFKLCTAFLSMNFRLKGWFVLFRAASTNINVFKR